MFGVELWEIISAESVFDTIGVHPVVGGAVDWAFRMSFDAGGSESPFFFSDPEPLELELEEPLSGYE